MEVYSKTKNSRLRIKRVNLLRITDRMFHSINQKQFLNIGKKIKQCLFNGTTLDY